MGIRGEFAPLREQAQQENWVAEGTKWAVFTLAFGIFGAYAVPYLLNTILEYAGREPEATGFAGFLIGAVIVNLDRFGRFWFVPALCMVAYVVFDLHMFEATKVAIEAMMANATK